MYEYKVNPSFEIKLGKGKSNKKYTDVKDNPSQLEAYLNASDEAGWQIFALNPVFITRRSKVTVEEQPK